jgi:DNA modification methylase
MEKRKTVAEQRKYAVLDVEAARQIALVWLQQIKLENAVEFGLPEVDDRYHIWRVPLVSPGSQNLVGEVVIDARTSLIASARTTDAATLESRLLGRSEGTESNTSNGGKPKAYTRSNLRNTIAQGDSEHILPELPAGSIELIFTSPPYYNARVEYSDYVSYQEYLLKLRKVIQQCHRVLAEGRFFVMNIAPVLVRRASRSEASRRIAVPFDVHQLFIEEGFDFVEDIIWEKPEGAGWATGRGRRFAADRNPLQYKAVPVTEYVLVYRKHTDKLIDWNIRAHPEPELVEQSRIGDDYERTNIWRIQPTYDKRHPAIFPVELAERVISYYSFKEDVVLDPFAGLGTVGKAATRLGRRFVLVEKSPPYVNIIRQEAKSWLGKDARMVITLNCPPISVEDTLL